MPYIHYCFKRKQCIMKDYIDLKLPSGLLWSKYNVGGKKEFLYGSFLSWQDVTNLNLPTSDDFNELLCFCDWKWTDNYYSTGIPGMICSSKTNNSSVFFPASGGYGETGVYNKNLLGLYWSSSVIDAKHAYAFCFGTIDLSVNDYPCQEGFCVRTVKK